MERMDLGLVAIDIMDEALHLLMAQKVKAQPSMLKAASAVAVVDSQVVVDPIKILIQMPLEAVVVIGLVL